jgi:hypothetical protein
MPRDIPATASSEAVATPSVWQDMLFLSELRDEMGLPSPMDRDGGDASDLGYKQYPRDPRWLVWLTVVACVLAAVSLFVILYFRIGA